MMIVPKGFRMEIKFCDGHFHTLVVENKALYREMVYSFDKESAEDYLIFSETYKPFAFAKKGIYIADPIIPELNNKKLMTKIASYLDSIANEAYYSELVELKSLLISFAEQLASHGDFELEYNCEVDTKALIKLFDYKLEKGDDGFAETLVRYIRILHQYLGISLFVVANLHRVFEKEELDFMFQTLEFEEINLLCIESATPDNVSSKEKMHIIDIGLCEIE